MRRSFNRSILPTEPPKKGQPLKKRRKKPAKCAMWQSLIWNWRRQVGEDFSLDAFAKAIGVHYGTAKRYFYGYVPHLGLHWPIVRYFAPYNEHDEKVLHDDLRATLREGRESRAYYDE